MISLPLIAQADVYVSGPLAVMALALVLDVVIGDPRWLYDRIAHPVALLGRVIQWLEGLLYPDEPARRVMRGGMLSGLLIVAAALFGWFLHEISFALHYGWLLEALFASVLLSFRALYDHVAAVARGLGEGLAEGRAAVAKIVGRDPDSLDGAGVCRAALESLAENFADGSVAPVFWYALFGLPGLFAYKAVNTLDSMIGHRNERYEDFGRVAARIDDAVNWLPARLSVLFVAAAALVTPGTDAMAALRTARRDARGHRSRNAGWPEAAMAGALGLALAGPRRYEDEAVDDAWMGDGRQDANVDDIARGLRLYLTAGFALLALLALLSLP